MWCACGVHVVYMWCTCGVHVVCMWCACGVHLVCMRCTVFVFNLYGVCVEVGVDMVNIGKIHKF